MKKFMKSEGFSPEGWKFELFTTDKLLKDERAKEFWEQFQAAWVKAAKRMGKRLEKEALLN